MLYSYSEKNSYYIVSTAKLPFAATKYKIYHFILPLSFGQKGLVLVIFYAIYMKFLILSQTGEMIHSVYI